MFLLIKSGNGDFLAEFNHQKCVKMIGYNTWAGQRWLIEAEMKNNFESIIRGEEPDFMPGQANSFVGV